MKGMSNRDDENAHRIREEYLRLQRMSQALLHSSAAAFINPQSTNPAASVASLLSRSGMLQQGPHEVWRPERGSQDLFSRQQHQFDATIDTLLAPVAPRSALPPIPDLIDALRMRVLSSVQGPSLALPLPEESHRRAAGRSTLAAPWPPEFARLEQQPLPFDPMTTIPSVQGCPHYSLLKKPVKYDDLPHQQQQALPEKVAAATKSLPGPNEASDSTSGGQVDESSCETLYRQHLLTTNVGRGAFFQAKSRRQYTHESFPEKLYRMLEETEREGHGDIVGFTRSGRAFEIRGVDDFLEVIIPKYFRQKSISSFRRQLSMYGFRRVKDDGPDNGAYSHELFMRGRPDLCRQMKRRSELELVLPSSSATSYAAASRKVS